MATTDAVEVAAEIVVAFVSYNSLPMTELPGLIVSVHEAVKGIAGLGEIAATVIASPLPAVSIRQSVTPDYLICLDDGRRFKSMRRHLAFLGMTPEQYRAKWRLPASYPMVAPNYAAQRSAMAKSAGFGRMRQSSIAAPPESPAKLITASSPATAKRKPGRPRKAPT